jgi:large subunit ribosomal protein L4
MAEITLKTSQGADAGNVELDDAVFGIQPNVPVMHQVVTAQLARRRAGTQSTKTRSEVRGGGAKPYRQKGTGNARQGSTNSPHYTGGGIALGPKPRSYAQRTPKKMIKLATRSALSDRASEGRVLVIDSWGFDGPKTKDAKVALAALGVTGRALVVIDSWESPAALSFRNLPEVQLIKAGELNAYDILCNDWIVFEQGQLPTADTLVTTRSAAAVEPETEVIAEHGEDPAEGAREVDDDTRAVTASAPDRSADEAATGVGSASEQPESTERASSEGDHSA